MSRPSPTPRGTVACALLSTLVLGGGWWAGFGCGARTEPPLAGSGPSPTASETGDEAACAFRPGDRWSLDVDREWSASLEVAGWAGEPAPIVHRERARIDAAVQAATQIGDGIVELRAEPTGLRVLVRVDPWCQIVAVGLPERLDGPTERATRSLIAPLAFRVPEHEGLEMARRGPFGVLLLKTRRTGPRELAQEPIRYQEGGHGVAITRGASRIGLLPGRWFASVDHALDLALPLEPGARLRVQMRFRATSGDPLPSTAPKTEYRWVPATVLRGPWTTEPADLAATSADALIAELRRDLVVGGPANAPSTPDRIGRWLAADPARRPALAAALRRWAVVDTEGALILLGLLRDGSARGAVPIAPGEPWAALAAALSETRALVSGGGAGGDNDPSDGDSARHRPRWREGGQGIKPMGKGKTDAGE